MKTTTYLRWSLLIPFVVWGLCLLVFLLISNIPGQESIGDSLQTMSLLDIVGLFIAFYVFGIIIWIFPYLLLGLILFFSSFIGKAQTMLRVFALSPIAMALLTVAIMIILDQTNVSGPPLNTFGGLNADLISVNLLFAGIALIWGYICVGIGYGIYKLLRVRGLIKDEVLQVPTPVTEPS